MRLNLIKYNLFNINRLSYKKRVLRSKRPQPGKEPEKAIHVVDNNTFKSYMAVGEPPSATFFPGIRFDGRRPVVV
jgi:hypothetical protein